MFTDMKITTTHHLYKGLSTQINKAPSNDLVFDFTDRPICMIADGMLYTGRLLNFKKHGHGTEHDIHTNKLAYKGDFKNNKYNGKGTLYSDTQILCGIFNNGECNEGELSYNNGDEYKGSFMKTRNRWRYLRYPSLRSNYTLYGSGTMHYKNGNVYKGTWDDTPSGHGHMKYFNGDQYDGNGAPVNITEPGLCNTQMVLFILGNGKIIYGVAEEHIMR
jgi:hypothetical protein